MRKNIAFVAVAASLWVCAASAASISPVRCFLNGDQCMADAFVLGNAGFAIAANETDDAARNAMNFTGVDKIAMPGKWMGLFDKFSMTERNDRAIFELRAAIKKGSRVIVPLAKIDLISTDQASCLNTSCESNAGPVKYIGTKISDMGQTLLDTKNGLRVCRFTPNQTCVLLRGYTYLDVRDLVEGSNIPQAQIDQSIVGAQTLASPPYIAVRGKLIKQGKLEGVPTAVVQADCVLWIAGKVENGRAIRKIGMTSTPEQDMGCAK